MILNKSPFLQMEFYGINGKNIANEIYNNPIPSSKVNELKIFIKKIKKNGWYKIH